MEEEEKKRIVFISSVVTRTRKLCSVAVALPSTNATKWARVGDAGETRIYHLFTCSD